MSLYIVSKFPFEIKYKKKTKKIIKTSNLVNYNNLKLTHQNGQLNNS